MSFLSADWGDRRPLDYVFIAVAGATILTFAGIGSYGVTVGFLQTNAYFKANDIVSFGCGVIAAGCALYLLLELTTERRGDRTYFRAEKRLRPRLKR